MILELNRAAKKQLTTERAHVLIQEVKQEQPELLLLAYRPMLRRDEYEDLEQLPPARAVEKAQRLMAQRSAHREPGWLISENGRKFIAVERFNDGLLEQFEKDTRHSQSPRF